MENIFVEFLPPWVETGLQPAFYDKESGSVLQQTARMYARVNMLIRMFNKLSKNTKETVEDYINQFNELHDYVHDYFDNLDVQEEINNKLDAMVEAGTMSDLIAQYIGLGALVVYDTLADLISSVNVSNGCKVKTLGKDTKGDGFGAYYTIGTTGDIALDNGLYATLVPNFGGNNYYSYYDDITTTNERYYNTTCYITTIPYHDHNSKVIKPYIAECDESPLRYAQKNKTSFTMNASLGKHTLIHDGELLVDRDSGNAELPDTAQYLAIGADRELIAFKANTATYQNMIASGAKEAWLVFYQIITNGVMPTWTDIDTDWNTYNPGSNIATTRHPRQCLGIKNDKTIIILTTDGRRPNEWGLTSEECATILDDLGCINAWNLDGGGSTSTSINGYKINSNIDNDYTADREAIDACLNIKLDTIDEELGNVNSYIGRAINDNNAKLMRLINGTQVTGHIGDVNPLIDGQSVVYSVNSTNSPSVAGYLETIPIPLPDLAGTYGSQVWHERARGRAFFRRKQNDQFTDWRPSDGYKSFLYNSAGITLDADNTYQKFTFTSPNIQHSVGYINFIEVTNNNTIKFNGDVTKALITVQFDLYCTNVSGGRYVQAKSGTTAIGDSLCQWRDTAGGTNTHTIQFVMPDTSKEMSIEFFGKQGDSIGRLKITAESMS